MTSQSRAFKDLLAPALASALLIVLAAREGMSGTLTNDEAYSAAAASVISSGRPFSAEANMWLYYLVLSLWRALAGNGEAATRIPSLAFGVASLFAVFGLARMIFPLRAACYSVLLLSVHPFFVRYSLEARSYSAYLFFSVIAEILFISALRRDSDRAWVASLAAFVLSFFSHFFAALQIPARVLLGASLKPWDKRFCLYVSFALLCILVTAACCGPDALSARLGWLAREPSYQLDFLGWLFGCNWLAGPPAVRPVVLGILLFGAGAGILRPSAASAPILQRHCVLALLLPILAAEAVHLVHPIFCTRFLIYSLVPLILLAGAGWERQRSYIGSSAVLIFCLSLLFYGFRAPLHSSTDYAVLSGRYLSPESRPAKIWGTTVPIEQAAILYFGEMRKDDPAAPQFQALWSLEPSETSRARIQLNRADEQVWFLSGDSMPLSVRDDRGRLWLLAERARSRGLRLLRAQLELSRE